MTTFEKIMRIIMKLTGILFAIESIGIFLGYYFPETWAVGAIWALLANSLLLGKYTIKKEI